MEGTWICGMDGLGENLDHTKVVAAAWLMAETRESELSKRRARLGLQSIGVTGYNTPESCRIRCPLPATSQPTRREALTAGVRGGKKRPGCW